MRCPRCTFSLVVRRLENVELDVCPRCHGMFIERGELLFAGLGDTSTWAARGVARDAGNSHPSGCE